ncbi:hypothetical protein Trydic_g891 [Trypoxylus dichotomus]
MVSSGLWLVGKNFAFHRDNDLKHTAEVCRDNLQEKQEADSLMGLPPQYSDHNSIELLWDESDPSVKQATPTHVTALQTLLEINW